LAKSEYLSDPMMAQSDPTMVLAKDPWRKIIVVLASYERDFRMLSKDELEYGTGSHSPEPLAWAEGERKTAIQTGMWVDTLVLIALSE
jgi:hypothetical protein